MCSFPKASLIDGLTQSSKTWKVFDLLNEHIKERSSTLVMFVTQANSTVAANQIVSRSNANHDLVQKFPIISRVFNLKPNVKSSMKESKESKESNEKYNFEKTKDNLMLVEFWNTRNMDMISPFAWYYNWERIILIVDEADQGCKEGLKARLNFIDKIERTSHSCVHVVFITATVANLSKSIFQVSKKYTHCYDSGIVNNIIHEKCVSHYYVIPKYDYIGPSWYIFENKDSWKILNIRKKMRNESKIDYKEHKTDYICSQINSLSQDQKKLCLIVVCTQNMEQNLIGQKLFDIGFNVVVELNSLNNKNYNVFFTNDSKDKNKTTEIHKWNIPYHEIELLANKGMLHSYRNNDRMYVKTGIESSFDISLSHVLQSALFMGTNEEKNIKENVRNPDEFVKLDALNLAICSIIRKKRPENYPLNPRIGLITGSLAGRGVTIQNSIIDFVCTSFCFLGQNDQIQRGAQNAQKFGRACGMLMDVFMTKSRNPIMIASPEIMFDAYANEKCLREKAKELENGAIVSLKDLVLEEDWKVLKRTTRRDIVARKNKNCDITVKDEEKEICNHKPKLSIVLARILDILAKNTDGLTMLDFQSIDEKTYDAIKKWHGSQLNTLCKEYGYIENIEKKWFITEKGKVYLE
jgi:hypothetical protein